MADNKDAEKAKTNDETTVTTDVVSTPKIPDGYVSMSEVQKMIADAMASMEKSNAAAVAKVKKASKETEDDDNKELPKVKIAQTKEQTEYLNELVPVRLFKDNNKYKDDVFVFVNGKPYQIKRGVNVMVPRCVSMAIDQSDNQDAYAADVSLQLQEDFKNEVVKQRI